MKIAITGATGFIGRGLTELLLHDGHDVTVLSRNAAAARSLFSGGPRALEWEPGGASTLVRELDGTDAFINLAGENIGSSPWTKAKRKRILDSRLSAGRHLTEIIASLGRKPEVFVQASAVGYYGSRGEETLDENSRVGEGFLAGVVKSWEDSTKELESLGVRRIIIRTGVVFDGSGGALPKLALPYKLRFGVVMGSGRQWVPWIHYSDELLAIRYLMDDKSASGIYNLVSPDTVRMDEVCSAISRVLRRPTVMHMPGPLLKLGLGKMAEETILPSQRVEPARLSKTGFRFGLSGLDDAVRLIFSRDPA